MKSEEYELQQYYISLVSSLNEETKEIIAKYYPDFHDMLSYSLDGYYQDFSEHTDSQIVINELEDVCSELGSHYADKTAHPIDKNSLEMQKDSYDLPLSSEYDNDITKERPKDNVSLEAPKGSYDSFTHSRYDNVITKDNGSVSKIKHSKDIQYASIEQNRTKKSLVSKKLKKIDHNLYKISKAEINELSYSELIHAFSTFLYPVNNRKRETYEDKYKNFDSLKPWLRGEKSLRDFSNYFCAGKDLDKASILYDKVLSWVKYNYKAIVSVYSESMHKLLDRAYRLNTSNLSLDIQTILINSCTSTKVLNKVSHNDVNTNDLLLICNNEEYKQIKRFLDSQNIDKARSYLTELQKFSTTNFSKMSFAELINAFAMYLYPTKKNLREIYAYRFQDPNFFKPWLRGERSFSDFAKYFCTGEICGNASIMFEKLTSWFNSSYKCKVLMYSEAMRELLDQNYGLNKSSLSPAIQNKLIYSCTSKEVLDKASEHELNVDDLLLICTKDEYKQICQFLNSDLNVISTEQVNESQNNNDKITEDKRELKSSSPVINTFKSERLQTDKRMINTIVPQKDKKVKINSVSQLDEYGQKAAQLVKEGNNLFITGKAGTGKSTVLRILVKDAKERRKNVVVLAPTGVAAKVAKGMTIHSFLHLPLGPYIPGHHIQGLYHLNDIEKELIRKLDTIFIDEVSMVRCDLLDEIDDVLRHYRKSKMPFGGIQIVMFGDLYQLMPVANDEDKEKLSKAYKIESLYFFNAKVYKKMDCKTFKLMKIYRQAENDFKDLLNDVREGHVDSYEIKKLESRYNKFFSPSDKEGYIRITTHNYRANKYNHEKLEQLPGDLYEFKASIPKGFIPKEEWPTDYHLRLKKGARVMFLRNDPDKRFVNGTLGTVTKLTEYSIRVNTDDGIDIDVEKSNWDFYKYKINKYTKEIVSELVGTFRQYPLKLAWAVTIHKSQGMQFSKVIIDAGHAFAYGQVYVALSRCEVFHNIFLVSKISSKIIQTDPVVKDFMRNAPRISLGNENEEEIENTHHLNFDPLKDTLWMIKDGLTLNQILTQSNEPAGIIYGRLIKLIKQGKVDIHRLLSAEKYNSIKCAFDKLGSTTALKKIKDLCSGCNFGEINLVKASLDISDKKT